MTHLVWNLEYFLSNWMIKQYLCFYFFILGMVELHPWSHCFRTGSRMGCSSNLTFDTGFTDGMHHAVVIKQTHSKYGAFMSAMAGVILMWWGHGTVDICHQKRERGPQIRLFGSADDSVCNTPSTEIVCPPCYPWRWGEICNLICYKHPN